MIPARLSIRIYSQGVLRHFEQLEISVEEMEGVAFRHVQLMSQYPHPAYLEIEFLDEPDREQRFVRIGTDPSRMVLPIEIQL